MIENDLDGTYADWAEALAAAESVDASWFYNDSLTYYRRGPFEPRHVDLFRRYFQTSWPTPTAPWWCTARRARIARA